MLRACFVYLCNQGSENFQCLIDVSFLDTVLGNEAEHAVFLAVDLDAFLKHQVGQGILQFLRTIQLEETMLISTLSTSMEMPSISESFLAIYLALS